MDPRRTTAIAIGAAAGAGIRWSLTRALGPDGEDVALLVVNLTGAALLGLLAGARPGAVSARTEALLGAGLCGALTTWSSLALRTAGRYRSEDWLVPSLWLLANLLFGVGIAILARRLMSTEIHRRGAQP